MRYKARHHHSGGLFFTVNSPHYLQPCITLRHELKKKKGKTRFPISEHCNKNTTYVHELPHSPQYDLVPTHNSAKHELKIHSR